MFIRFQQYGISENREHSVERNTRIKHSLCNNYYFRINMDFFTTDTVNCPYLIITEMEKGYGY